MNGLALEDKHTFTVTVANGASLSGEIDLQLYTPVAIIPPAGTVGTLLSFQVGIESGALGELANSAGLVSYPLAAAQPLALNISDFLGWQFLKIRCGTAASASNQNAARTFTIVCKLI